MGIAQTSILKPYILDHLCITLIWMKAQSRMGIPFKYSHISLEDPKFDKLVSDTWLKFRITESSPMWDMVEKLHELKRKVKIWERCKKQKLRMELDAIHSELEVLGQKLDLGNPSNTLINSINALEKKKQHILHIQEVNWRLKSRAIWLKEVDRNTQFLHRYANYRRKINSI